MNLMLAYKVLAAVLALSMAVAGMGVGGGVVFAADAMPGDFLYPVKLLSEDVKLALNSDPVERAEMEMAFVGLRVQEMMQLAQRGEDVPQAVVQRMTRLMEQVMVEIAKARPEEAPALLTRLMDRTRAHQQLLEDLAAGSAAETQLRLREASQLMERTRLNAENDPQYLEYQRQYQYEGAAGPHGEISPPAQGAGQQNQEQNQNGYQGEQGSQGAGEPVQNQNQNSYQGEQGAGEPIQEQTQQQAGEQTQQQTQQQAGEQTQQQTGEQTQEQTQQQSGEQTQEQMQQQSGEQTQEQMQQQTGEQTQEQTQQQSPKS